MQNVNIYIYYNTQDKPSIHLKLILSCKSFVWFGLRHNLSVFTFLPFVIFCCHGCRETQRSMETANGGVVHGTLST